MVEPDDGAIQELSRVRQRRMRASIQQRVREPSGQGLRHSQIREITVGNQQRSLNVEEPGQLNFQPFVNLVIASGRSRSRNVQSKCCQSFPRGAQHFWMAGQPEVIAAAKVGKPFPATGNVFAIDLLERRG